VPSGTGALYRREQRRRRAAGILQIQDGALPPPQISSHHRRPTMFFPYIDITKINVATVNQSNNAFGQNIAVGSVGATQTLVQLQSNSANVNQG
jgi:hypothetical protein